MKIILRIIKYAFPLEKVIASYLFYTFFAVLFGTLNITLLGPLLDILFSDEKNINEVIEFPSFEMTIDYFVTLFKYYSIQFSEKYGILGSLFFICGCIIFCSLIANLAKFMQTLIIERFQLNMIKRLRNVIFEHILTLDIQTYLKKNKSTILTHISQDIVNIQNGITSFLTAIFRDIFQLVVFLFALFYISYKLTLASLILLPFTAIFISKIVKSLRKKIQTIVETQGDIFNTVDETLDGFRIVKAFNAEEKFKNDFHNSNNLITKASIRRAKRDSIISPFSEFFGILSVSIIVIYGGYLVTTTQEVSPSNFLVFVAIFSQVLRPAKSFNIGLSSLFSATVSGKRVLDFLETKPKIFDKPESKVIHKFTDSIKFENVSFGYDTNSLVLKNISFEVKKHETVGLVGFSGSGKTSILNLIGRFYDVQSGKICIDGMDIRDLKLSPYRQQIGVVSQDTVLFNDTIINNIKLGNPFLTDDEIIKISKAAHVHEFVQNLKDGYNTCIGHKGGNLSGGQRQRVAIARALAKKPSILLFDEATSSLDGESESIVQQTLLELKNDYTCIIVAHRLSTIKHANKILVVHKGEIAEEGSHEELRSLDGLYEKLFQLHQLGESNKN